MFWSIKGKIGVERVKLTTYQWQGNVFPEKNPTLFCLLLLLHLFCLLLVPLFLSGLAFLPFCWSLCVQKAAVFRASQPTLAALQLTSSGTACAITLHVKGTFKID